MKQLLSIFGIIASMDFELISESTAHSFGKFQSPANKPTSIENVNERSNNNKLFAYLHPDVSPLSTIGASAHHAIPGQGQDQTPLELSS